MTNRQPAAARRRARAGAGRRRSIARALVAAAVAVLGVQAAGSPDRAAGQLKLQRIGSFDQPVYVDSAPAFHRLVFVVEQPGRVSVLRNGHRLSQPFLDIQSRVSCCGERGLFSIAFDPSYGRNHLVYAYYTNRQGNLEIDEFHAPSGTRALMSSRRQVIVIPHPGWSNHNGGQLQFGPDGYLYIGTGDGGGSEDSGDNARHLNVLLGKLLRIDPHRQGGHAYGVPASNPFVGRSGARPEIYSYGLRNPWRFSFNPKTGTLAIGDVGQSQREELDYTKIQRAKGANFGWPKWEGDSILRLDRPDPNPNPPFPVFPILTYTHARRLRDRRRLRGSRRRSQVAQGPLPVHRPVHRGDPQRHRQPRRGERRSEHRPPPEQPELLRRGPERASLRHLPGRAGLQA